MNSLPGTGERVARAVSVAAALLLLLPLSRARAQSAAESNTNIPANATGPKDFEGLWLANQGPPRQGPGGAPGGPPAGGAPPLQTSGSTLQCAPVQRLSAGGGGMSTLILQSPTQIVLVSEEDMDIARKIYLNSAHPAQLQPQPNGHSIGHWEGDTLVVDSLAFSDQAGQDKGDHVVERISKQGSTLNDEITITAKDGSVRAQSAHWAWRPDLQFNENICEEGFDRYQIINGKLDNPNIPPDRQSDH